VWTGREEVAEALPVHPALAHFSALGDAVVLLDMPHFARTIAAGWATKADTS
jgi:hypothetical protein